MIRIQWKREVINNFKKDLFKLMGKNMFDKTIENKRKTEDFKFINDDDSILNFLSNSNL